MKKAQAKYIKKQHFSRTEQIAYTTSMSYFVRATKASQPKTKNIQTVSLALAGLLIVMALAQLFTFEKFSAAVMNMWLPGSDVFSHVYAALIVTFEVFAIPFLFSMRLSPAMRVASMGSGWVMVAIWLFISLWINTTSGVVSNTGMLGAAVRVPVGWWNILFAIALGVLVAWVSWGMWPFKRVKHKK